MGLKDYVSNDSYVRIKALNLEWILRGRSPHKKLYICCYKFHERIRELI